jgi:hypothetical protein
MSKGMEKIGVWSFIVGLILALIAALVWPNTGWVALVLGILGILVGLINISDKETTTYLIAAIALIVGAGGLVDIIAKANIAVDFLTSLMYYIIAFVAPGAVVVAIKAIFGVARGK